MHIIVCGAGEVGTYAAEVLSTRGQSITVIDLDPLRLREIEDTLDVAVLQGNGADDDILKEAGVERAELLVAATDSDDVNLLTASIAKGLGARKSVARVHHIAYYEQRGFDYAGYLNIDQLICPEYATALAIARKLRNPGAVAIESFVRGQIELQEFTASQGGSAIGQRLMDVRLPDHTRLAMIRRKGQAFIPEAGSVVAPGDGVILVGNTGAFSDARKLFHAEKPVRRSIVLMGGTPMAVWLARALRDRTFSIRLFEKDRERAVQLAEQLDWVTVINADPTNRIVFEEERLGQADTFIALLDSDESNIIAGVLAKTRGVEQVITIVQRSKYLDLIYDIGVDLAFNTREVAGQEIEAILDETPLRPLGTLAAGAVDVVRILIEGDGSAADGGGGGGGAGAIGRPLKELGLSPDWVMAAIQRDRRAWVPTAQDTLLPGDAALLVGKHGTEDRLREVFGVE